MIGFILLVALVGGLFVYVNLDRVVNYIAQTLVDASKMDITSIQITECDETGFTINLTARIYDTGPLEATISGMALSMFSTKTGKEFAKITLPPIHAAPSGTVCEVTGQRVEILDFAAFDTFNRNLLLQGELPAYVRGSGKLTLSWPVQLSTSIKYDKVEMLPGLDGVHIVVLRTRKASRSLLKGKPTEIEVDVSITSKSPVSIHMGVIQTEILFESMRVAKVEADVFLKPGENHVTFTGYQDLASITANLGTGIKFLKQDLVDKKGVVASVKGTKGKQCDWLDRVVKAMNSRIVMTSTMVDILKSTQGTENEDEVEEAEAAA